MNETTYTAKESYLVDTGGDPAAYASTDLAKARAWVEKRCQGLNVVVWHRQVVARMGNNKDYRQRNRYSVVGLWKDDRWVMMM